MKENEKSNIVRIILTGCARDFVVVDGKFTCIVPALGTEKVEISLFVKFEPLVATSDREIRIAYPYPAFCLQEMVITARSLSNKNLYSAKY